MYYFKITIMICIYKFNMVDIAIRLLPLFLAIPVEKTHSAFAIKTHCEIKYSVCVHISRTHILYTWHTTIGPHSVALMVD